ncbi:MAG: hypothetical protein V2B18_25365 [Pseudomonadota bacterium]
MTSFGMLAGSGTQAWAAYEGGQAAQEMYNLQAKEALAQTVYEQRLALESMKDLDVQQRSAEHAAVAQAGKSGLRVGGSTVTLTQSIARTVQRRKGLINLQFQESKRRNRTQAAMYQYLGRQEALLGKMGAAQSLLTGFEDLSERKKGLGRSRSGLFFPDIDKRRKAKTAMSELYPQLLTRWNMR